MGGEKKKNNLEKDGWKNYKLSSPLEHTDSLKEQKGLMGRSFKCSGQTVSG